MKDQPHRGTTVSTEVRGSVDRVFRRRFGQLVATLTRIIGIQHLDLVEDLVQDAFVQALKKWPHAGVPKNPDGWVLTVARNRAVDVLRSQGRWRDKRDELERSLPAATEAGQGFFSTELGDDQLRMTFACCHPALPRDAQVALTLKTVGGFSVAEITRAFLTTKATIAQRLVRAKRALRRAGVTLEIPAADDLPAHLDAVLEVLYLTFNEGYGASAGDALVRAELCDEAIRLAELIAAHPVVGAPKVNALASLFLFQAARLPARVDERGEQVLLGDQDRSAWDRRLLRRALVHLRLAARGRELSGYHLEAEIASCHALGESFERTDWARILECYDRLMERSPSPIVALNRVVAVSRVEGTAAGLAALAAIAREPALARYGPRYAIEADLLERAGRSNRAVAAWSEAIALSGSEPVRRYLERRLRELNDAKTKTATGG